MPLLDHFHPPLSERRHWHSFHNSWATYLSSQINALLPAGYFAMAEQIKIASCPVSSSRKAGKSGRLMSNGTKPSPGREWLVPTQSACAAR